MASKTAETAKTDRGHDPSSAVASSRLALGNGPVRGPVVMILETDPKEPDPAEGSVHGQLHLFLFFGCSVKDRERE